MFKCDYTYIGIRTIMFLAIILNRVFQQLHIMRTFAELEVEDDYIGALGHCEFLDGVDKAISNDKLPLVAPFGNVHKLGCVMATLGIHGKFHATFLQRKKKEGGKR